MYTRFPTKAVGRRPTLTDLHSAFGSAHLNLIDFLWWRGKDSNLRPRGYEPRKLPLLYRANWWVKDRSGSIILSRPGGEPNVSTHRLIASISGLVTHSIDHSKFLNH